MTEQSLLLTDYTGKRDDSVVKKLEGVERRLHNMETLLWDNRDKYMSSLDIVANRETEITEALHQVRSLVEKLETKMAKEQEILTQEWSRVMKEREFLIQEGVRAAKERELLIKLLNENKEILHENRKLYIGALNELREEEIKNGRSLEKLSENAPIFLAPNPIFQHRNR
jgi:hypothetical protein